MKQKKIACYLTAIAFSFGISFFVSQSNFHFREGSDLPAYEKFYYCLMQSSYYDCTWLINSSYEYAFYFLFDIISFSGVNFRLFLFLFAFFLYASLSLMVVKLSSDAFNLYWLSLIFILTDFRFYDFGFNILRHGLASALMVFSTALFVYNSSKLKYIFIIIPLFAHISAIAQFSLVARAEFLNARLLWFIVFLVLFGLHLFSVNILTFFIGFDYIGDKLYFYKIRNEYSEWMPLHYFLVLFLALTLDINNKSYIIIRRVFFTLTALSIIFIPLGMGYRFIAYAMPFTAIIITYQISFIIDSFSRESKFCVYAVILLGFVGFVVIYLKLYVDFILGGLR